MTVKDIKFKLADAETLFSFVLKAGVDGAQKLTLKRGLRALKLIENIFFFKKPIAVYISKFHRIISYLFRA